MLIVADDRNEVRLGYLASFAREGVCAAAFDFAELPSWFSALSDEDIAAIEVFIFGECGDRGNALQIVRRRSAAPAIALNDRRSLDVTLELLSSGFDDVLAKPIHVRELRARAHVICVRHNCQPRIQEVAGIRMFPDGRDPQIQGAALDLPRRELRILECLVRARGAWLTKAQIFNRVYGLLNDGIDENVIESHISRLRKRLRDRLDRDPIESQRFIGYRIAEPDDSRGGVAAWDAATVRQTAAPILSIGT